jgi:hypothetical protein
MSLKLTLAASIAALTMFAAGAALAATGEAKSPVNIREEATVKSDILGVLNEGDEVECVDFDNGWCELAGGDGYVSAAYLDFDHDEDDEEYDDDHDHDHDDDHDDDDEHDHDHDDDHDDIDVDIEFEVEL